MQADLRPCVSPLRPAPLPPPGRQQIYTQHHMQTAGQPFRTLCYNVLAQIYATKQMYPYCELWALSWSFRKKAILREILQHNADIICLQVRPLPSWR